MSANLQILYEDDDVLAVSKPEQMAVNRSDSYRGQTVQDWMQGYLTKNPANLAKENWQSLIPQTFTNQYGEPEQIFEERVGMVHRLDKDTSGVLLLAKNPGSLLNLLDQFKNRQTEKEYVCLTHGKFFIKEGRVELPIARRSDNRLRFGVVPEGRSAVTSYRVEQFFPDFKSELLEKSQQNKRFELYQGFSLVRCWPKTGRTHQIRVHMQHLQHPIVGDKLYVGKKRAKLDQLWCKRQFLHAHKLTFTHPRTKKSITVAAPLPEDLNSSLLFIG